ncbi:MAG: glycosyltransferase family 2 protein [Candidatus Doudnabacteria bacterium]
MPKLSINLLRWNTPWQDIHKVIDAVLAQDYRDYELVYSENADSNQPVLIGLIKQTYPNHPNLRIVNNGGNLGYAGGQNKFFKETPSDLLMVLNPDAILKENFLSEMVKAFEDPAVGFATGKMIKPEKNKKGEWVIDGTGIIIFKSRRARERGQLEEDHGQYDSDVNVFGISGSAAIYRKSALEAVKIKDEYFDSDFFAYWEDLDLSWRLRLQGFNAKYVPSALVYHTRAVGVSPGGYKKLTVFVRHHSNFSLNVRRWNWRNHLFAIIKNDFGWSFWKSSPLIIGRELAMLGFIIIFEPRTLGAIPIFLKLLPKMIQKRKIIQSKKTVTSSQMEGWFK